jgi:hypothetical protein
VAGLRDQRVGNSFYWTVTAIAALMVVVAIVRYSVGWITDVWTLVGIWFLAALFGLPAGDCGSP